MDLFEKLLENIFKKEIKLPTKDHPILVIDKPYLNNDDNREKIAKLIFEKFEAGIFYITSHDVLSLYSTGKISGINIDFGEDITFSSAIYEGYSIIKSNFTELGGRHLTDYLKKLLDDRGCNCNNKYIKNIKEKLCYFSNDYQNEIKNFSKLNEKTYELPDEKTITLKEEMFKVPEIFFQPKLFNLNEKNIMNCIDISYSKNLRTGEKTIQSPLDLISLRAFNNNKVRKSSTKQKFTHWLPVYINKEHSKKAMKF